MKFISKNLNLRVVLKPSIPAERLTGRPAQAGIYAKFEDGQLLTDDENIIQMLRNHPSFNGDFVEVTSEEQEMVLQAGRVGESEPDHTLMEIKHGSPGKNQNPIKPKLTPEMRKLVMAEAQKMVQSLLEAKISDVTKTTEEKSETPKKETAPKSQGTKTKK